MNYEKILHYSAVCFINLLVLPGFPKERRYLLLFVDRQLPNFFLRIIGD